MILPDVGKLHVAEEHPRAHPRPELLGDWRDFESFRAAAALYQNCEKLQKRVKPHQLELARAFLREPSKCPLDFGWAAPLFFLSWLRIHRPSAVGDFEVDLWEDASIGAAAAWARDGFENPGLQRLIIVYGSSRFAVGAIRAERAGESARVARLASPDQGWPVLPRPAFALLRGNALPEWQALPV